MAPAAAEHFAAEIFPVDNRISSFKGNLHGLHSPDPSPGVYYVLV